MQRKHQASGNLIILLCAVIYFVSYFARKDFAAVLAEMLQAQYIDKSLGGWIGTGMFICYGIGQLISGYLGDKLRPQILLSFGLFVTFACNLLMPLVPHTTAMIPIWALNGFAQAMLWPPIVRILADHLDHKRFVMANLIVTSAAHVSTILLYLYVPLCIQTTSWKAVFFSASALAMLALILLVIMLKIFVFGKSGNKEDSQPKDDVAQEKAGFWPLFCRAGIIPIFGSIVMMGFLRDGIESWLPTLYSEAFGRSVSESILVSAILPVFSMLAILLITLLHRTKLFHNETRGSAILFSLAAIVCVLLSVLISFEQPILRMICLLLAALICSMMHGVNFLYISCLPGRFASYGKAATASGFCNACTYVGAAISMYGIGAVSQAWGWRFTALSWCLVGAIGAIFSILAYRAYTKFIAK